MLQSLLSVSLLLISHVCINIFPVERFTKVLLEQQQDRAKREQERIRLLTADPFDLEAQAKIEEDIRYMKTLEAIKNNVLVWSETINQQSHHGTASISLSNQMLW